MRFLILCGLCMALLAGCSPQTNTEPPEGPPVIQLAPTWSAEIPLTDAPPYDPWVSLAPAAASIAPAGEILCSTPLPDGSEVLCYRAETDGDTKYWAIRREDTLLPFCEETACYTDGYAAELFTNVLGQEGFRITAPRGAAYIARDYYTVDESGTPRLLAACANEVIEADLNGDGERELLWFYHGGREIFYIFRQEGILRELCLTDVLAQQAEPWLVIAVFPPAAEEGCLPVEALRGGWDALSPEAEFLPARLRFTAEAVSLEPLS